MQFRCDGGGAPKSAGFNREASPRDLADGRKPPEAPESRGSLEEPWGFSCKCNLSLKRAIKSCSHFLIASIRGRCHLVPDFGLSSLIFEVGVPGHSAFRACHHLKHRAVNARHRSCGVPTSIGIESWAPPTMLPGSHTGRLVPFIFSTRVHVSDSVNLNDPRET